MCVTILESLGIRWFQYLYKFNKLKDNKYKQKNIVY